MICFNHNRSLFHRAYNTFQKIIIAYQVDEFESITLYFRIFFVIKYLNICKLRPIFICLKFIRMQEMGLTFQKFPGVACTRTPLAWLHACGACLLRACGARPFAAAPLMKHHNLNDYAPPFTKSWIRPCIFPNA